LKLSKKENLHGTAVKIHGFCYDSQQHFPNKNPRISIRGSIARIYHDINFFSHPDFTVGTGILCKKVTGSAACAGRGLYRRLGLTPYPEEFILF
jgi:hypothetical protein